VQTPGGAQRNRTRIISRKVIHVPIHTTRRMKMVTLLPVRSQAYHQTALRQSEHYDRLHG